MLIEKREKLCENVGSALIDLSIEKGKYKVYYMRIENEQRILSNSRLEILGQSKIFSINQLTSDHQDPHVLFEDSFSAHQFSQKKNRFGSPASLAESSLDSLVLMR